MIKILAVEDEAASREALVLKLRNILGDEGLVESAEDGRNAIRKALDIAPDLIFMDIEMPYMDGLEAAAVVREHLPDTKVVFLTAYDSFDYAVRALRVGSRDYLLKPVSEHDLRQLLAKMFHIAEEQSGGKARTPFASALEVWLASHYSENISLDDAAGSMGMSAAYFSRKVKAETGRTFLEHLTDLRVAKAEQRLRTTNMSVNDISKSVGYPDPGYFVKVFKRSTGMTPSEYRLKEGGQGGGEDR